MTILALFAAAYVLFCLVAFSCQSRLVYFPERALVTTPREGGLEYRDVFFETEDGQTLHGWFVPAAAARHVLLFFHGNAGNISHRLESIRIFHRLGLSVFIVDYRGYGRSEGRISEAGSYEDARAALRYLTGEAGFPQEDIVYFGRSLGGAVAIELATEYTPKALIAESCFTSIPDLGARLYRWLPVRFLVRIKYDSVRRVAELTCPKLFIHSSEDEVVPYELGYRLFEAASEPKDFLEIRGDHNGGFLISGETYVNGLRRFLASLE